MVSFSRVVRNLSMWFNVSHVLPQSCWALAGSTGLGAIALGAALTFHCSRSGHTLLSLGFFLFVWVLYSWWSDVDEETVYHTEIVNTSMKLGMMVFIISEIMFFVGFFWAFFHSSLNADHSIGCIWPPKNFPTVATAGLPLLNTYLLLLSGFYATEAFILSKTRPLTTTEETEPLVSAVDSAVLCGTIFMAFQVIEYRAASFTIASGIYGSIFFLATGFHGLHVFIGIVALAITSRVFDCGGVEHETEQLMSKQELNFIGFELATWYWHFVDVVWICLFICVYWWGGN